MDAEFIVQKRTSRPLKWDIVSMSESLNHKDTLHYMKTAYMKYFLALQISVV